MKHNGLTISSSLSRKNGTWIYRFYDINMKKFELTEKAIAQIVLVAVNNSPSDSNLPTLLKNIILCGENVKEQE